MRALGFAATALGAVVALSCTLGMTYRSDGLGAIDTSSSAASASDTASGSGTPSDSGTPGVSSAPASASSPSDSSNPSGDPSTDAPSADPTDVPSTTSSPAAGRYFSALELPTTAASPGINPPDMSYVFTPGTVEVIGNYTDGADAGQTVVGTLGDGFTADPDHVPCVWTVDPASGDAQHCFFDLPAGTWAFPSTQSWGTGDTAITSPVTEAVAIVPAAPTLSAAVNADDTFLLSGSGIAGDTVTVNHADGSGAACSVTVDNGGTWGCTTSALAPGSYSFSAIETATASCDPGAVGYCDEYQPGGMSLASEPQGGDIPEPSGGGTGASLPVASYSFAPSTISVSHGFTGGADYGHTELFLEGDGDTLLSSCDWADESDCEFDDVAPGLYRVVSTQGWSDDSQQPSSVASYIVIPDAPTLSLASEGDLPWIHGTGAPGDTILVVEGVGEGQTQLCEPTVGEDGSWSCDEDVSTSQYYQAYEIDTADCGEAWYCAQHEPGGISALALYQPPASGTPTVRYQFLPGGIIVTATSSDGEADVRVNLYSWTPDQEDPWNDPATCEGSNESASLVCPFTGLAPGVYNPYSAQAGGSQSGGDGDAVDDYFVVPETPTISTTTAAANGKVTLSGTGVAGDGIHVIIDNTTLACGSITVSTAGTWSCTTAGLAAGTHHFAAYLEDLGGGRDDRILGDDPAIAYMTGGLSALSAARPLTIAAPTTTPTPTPTSAPTPQPTVPAWFFTVTGVDLNNVHPGDHFTVTGTGLPPGAIVSGELHSVPISIGSTGVLPDGSFSLPVTVPADFEPGAHQLVMTLAQAGGAPVTSAQPITVVPATAPDASVGGSTGGSDSSENSSSSSNGGTAPHGTVGGSESSNILTHGLQSIADVVGHPGKIPAALAIGLVLLLFAVLPAHLLNATIAEQYERFTRRMPRLARRPKWFERLTAFLRRAPIVAGLALTTITALLFGFADPRFGFTLASLRLILALAIAMATVVYLVNAVTSLIMRRGWKVDVEVSLRPLGLLLTIAGVIVSRVLDFSPGFLVGLVLGLSIAEKSAAKHAWRAILIRSGLVMGLAIVAWLGFSIFSAGETEGEIANFGSELFLEILVAIVTEGIVALLIELLPFRLLEGQRLYERSRPLWAGIYLLVIVIFVVAVVPWEGNWEALGDSLWTWIGIVVGFGIVCTGIYLYFRFVAPPLHDDKVPDDELIPVGEAE